ncbi:MAG: B12-binding domain-containing protein [Pseudomonadota bacterium]
MTSKRKDSIYQDTAPTDIHSTTCIAKTGGKNVAIAGDQPPLARYRAYSERHTKLLRLAKRLPSQQTERLAREAIRRLSTLRLEQRRGDTWETRKQVERLCSALIDDDETAAARIVFDLNAAKIKPEVVYLDYLAAAAERLEEWWEQDRASFWQITVATCRLLAIIRSMNHLFEPYALQQEKSAIFAGVPGEQHTIGLRMASDIFRKDGWNVVLLIGLGHNELIDRIASTHVRVIGLSMSSKTSLDALSKLMISIHVCKPYTPVFLNGNGVKDIRAKLKWMDFAGVSDDLEEAKESMNAWIDAHPLPVDA